MVEPNAPNETDGPEGVDPEGRTLPPYDDRRATADVDGPDQASRDGAKVGGATGPVENDDMARPEPGRHPWRRHRLSVGRAAGGRHA